MITLMDRAPLERVRKLADGRIAAVARFARSGVYTYSGAEVGEPHIPIVNVYRPDDEVFSQDAMASFAHQAVTFDHPADGVSPANWKKVAVGFTEGRVARDGGFVEIPLMLADAEAIAAYERGEARELSAGYNCELLWGDGVAPDGTPYQAKQAHIRGNHIALVPQGRAGSACRIGDSLASGASAMFTDAERAFADSDAGREAIARAKSAHDLNAGREGFRPFSDADALAAIRAASSTGHSIMDQNALDQASAASDAAYARSAADLNAWRNS
ncbi:hypothetical protein GCM10007897_44370 [Sphingobium jiangsuense]|uniref:DUF2213 domain-containing protein n=1 Tax=Sphingobium jiangsuense TaxID=870476 RepID=A0A7W6BKP1_9SPHN|nr:DUF2213 domain-containing protein [Sphingobium jiangsuense]MBB3928835.1 hypothetical protein [Sphingobium jiangsuense]GLT02999.1 hypothetical protein GCM10007897_44370 [Sphingobium jiangsuense]